MKIYKYTYEDPRGSICNLYVSALDDNDPYLIELMNLLERMKCKVMYLERGKC